VLLEILPIDRGVFSGSIIGSDLVLFVVHSRGSNRGWGGVQRVPWDVTWK
jgi:hypothetical protein